MPSDEFPTLSVADDLAASDADERFEFALELLVRGSKRWRGSREAAGAPLALVLVSASSVRQRVEQDLDRRLAIRSL